MFSTKLFILLALVAIVAAEPPRKRRLPLRLPARQTAAEEEFQGYNYPKPTDAYGPPAESEEPSNEYGPPEQEPSNEYGPPESEEPAGDDAPVEVEAEAEAEDTPDDSEPHQFRSFRRNQKNQKLKKSKSIFLARQPTYTFQQLRVVRLV